MVPITFAYGLVGMTYLNAYSSEFQTLPRTIVALIVFGYLKPSDLKHEAEKSHYGVMHLYQISYLVIAATIIVNFLVTIINDTHGKTKSVNRDDDILQFLSNKKKEKFSRRREKDFQRQKERTLSMVTPISEKQRVQTTTADEILSSARNLSCKNKNGNYSCL